MRILEYKIKAKPSQYQAIEEAIRTVQFIRNKSIRYWMDAAFDANAPPCPDAGSGKGRVKINRFVLNKYSTELRNDLIAYEDLRVANLLKNHCLAKSIADASWYQFRQWIEHFATKFGRLAVAVPPQYTSQECSQCQAIVKKSLSTRTHVCSCGLVLQRDWNAAINILLKAKSRDGQSRSNANGDGTSTLLGATLVEQVLSMKLESPLL